MQIVIKKGIRESDLSMLHELGIDTKQKTKFGEVLILSLSKDGKEVDLVSSEAETTLTFDHKVATGGQTGLRDEQELLAGLLVMVRKFGGTIILDENDEPYEPMKAWSLLVRDEKETVRAFLEKHGVLPPDALREIRKMTGKAFF